MGLQIVPVFEWLSGGDVVGCGTQREFDHWQREGVLSADDRLGGVIAHEPASEDDRRLKAWAR